MIAFFRFNSCLALCRVFPGEAQSDRDASSVGGTKQWLMASISHLMTLTLMSLAGYVKLTSSGTAAVGAAKRLTAPQTVEVNAMYKTPSKAAPPSSSSSFASTSAAAVSATSEVVAFPMPPPSFFSPLNSKRSLHTNDVLNFVDASEALSFVSPSTALKVLPSSSHPTELEPSTVPKVSPLFLSLKCVVVGRSDEIEQLWLETCKIYSELANSPMSNVSLRSIYCLRVR